MHVNDCSSFQVCMVKCDYVVMVRTHSFSNPESLLANGTCCDFNVIGGDGESCAVPGCDTYFTYCLRRNGVDQLCRISQTNLNDRPLDFSQPAVLDLPNPVPLLGLTTEWIPNVSCNTSSLL